MATDPIDPSFGLWSPVWSPDGRWLAFVAAGYRADNTTGPGSSISSTRTGAELHALSTAPASAEGGLSWSPDPAVLRLLYTGAGTTPTVRMVDVGTGIDQELVASYWPTWSPDGTRFSSGGPRSGRPPTRWPGGAGDHRHPRMDGREELRSTASSRTGTSAVRPSSHPTAHASSLGTSRAASILSVMADGTGQPIVIPLETNVKDRGNPVVWQPAR